MTADRARPDSFSAACVGSLRCPDTVACRSASGGMGEEQSLSPPSAQTPLGRLPGVA